MGFGAIREIQALAVARMLEHYWRTEYAHEERHFAAQMGVPPRPPIKQPWDTRKEQMAYQRASARHRAREGRIWRKHGMSTGRLPPHLQAEMDELQLRKPVQSSGPRLHWHAGQYRGSLGPTHTTPNPRADVRASDYDSGSEKDGRHKIRYQLSSDDGDEENAFGKKIGRLKLFGGAQM